MRPGAVLSALALLLPASPAAADAVTLKSGRILQGRLVEEGEKALTIETFAGRRSIPRELVAKHDPKGGKAFEKYEAEALAGAGDPEAQRRLFRTCLKEQAFERAQGHLDGLVALAPDDPGLPTARRDLEKARASWRKGRPGPTGVTLVIGLAKDLTQEEEKWLIDQVRDSSLHLFRISCGGLYIAELVLEPRSHKGHLVYDRTFTGMPNGSTNIPMGEQNMYPPVVVHEMGHALWGLPDDDNAGNGGEWGKSKYPCVMAHHWDQGYCPDCRKLLCVAYRKERLSAFFDRLPEEVDEGELPETAVTRKEKAAEARKK